jgi:hypothetical protein
MKSSCIASLVVVAGLATTLSVTAGTKGGIVMDGVLDDAYGKALAIQNVQTQFGDSNLGLIDFANGSELNSGHGFIDADAGFLRVFLTGNLESNFNKLDVFIDFRDGGQNRLRGDNPDVDFNGLNRMGDDGSGNGLTFDKGFAADLYITFTGGNSPYQTFANSADILTDGGGSGGFLGSGGAGTAFLNGGNGIQIAIDNSNTAGVGGGTGKASGAGVTTGIEIAIPLSLLGGYDGRDVLVSAFVNGGGHDFLSNQVLGGAGAGTGNLGEPRNVNFNFLSGLQYFAIPGSGGSIPGDFDGNGSVDAADLAILLGAWGTPDADLDGNGDTDAADLAILLGNWS